jgi:hypothetical protein
LGREIKDMEDWLSPLHAVQYILSFFSLEHVVQALIEYAGKENLIKIIEKRK